MDHPQFLVARQGALAVVTFNRPEMHNAFNLSMWAGLQQTMESLSAEDALRCVVLRGAGTEAFSAGADISEFATARVDRLQEDQYAKIFNAGMQSIRLCRHPVVAMIMGNCLGGGAGIATMCDFRVGGENIRFGITARNMGLWYSYAELDVIIQIAGTGIAAEMLIEGRIYDGREAYDRRLLSRVVPEDRVEAEAIALAERISEGAPLAARFHKAAIRKLRGPLPVTEADISGNNAFVETEDFRNAAEAFLAKQRPIFIGR
ncbi:MAG: enoyl-CoA hydratase/isomerase family protein [Acetobacteraceae bacterium]|nr:enoyl-CoA hydratase/isomerase family protein [Acetobacteraceae bacterium]MBV8520825.1 enoyl-CoA hydratase/isomerase family protein [Acetobacteraceae bacterium]